MAEVRTTVSIDEDLLRMIRVAAAREGRRVSEEALRATTFSGILERVRQNADLSEEEAWELATSELAAMRTARNAKG